MATSVLTETQSAAHKMAFYRHVSDFQITAIFFTLFCLIMIYLRSSLHVDEARYLSVAFEMYTSNGYLVPHLNGASYSHKAPLLFWLTCLVWHIIGVSEFAARLIPLFLTLGSAALVQRLASSRAAIIFLGFTILQVWAQAFMFDNLMMLCVILGWVGLTERKNWLIALAIACGILTKGPVIFVYILPAAFFLARQQCKETGLIGSLKTLPYQSFFIGTAVALVWVALALYYGDPSYREAILWKQTAGRLVNSFNHQRPWWFYPAVLPAILFPWIAVPKLWQSLKHRSYQLSELDRTMLLATLVTLGCFQLISCKQLQYLFPLLPVLAIVADRLLINVASRKLMLTGLFSMIASMAVLSLADTQLERHFPFKRIAQQINPNNPLVIVADRYKGEYNFASRLPQIRHISESEFNATWLTSTPNLMAIISTTQPQTYSHPDQIFQVSRKRYILIMKSKLAPEA